MKIKKYSTSLLTNMSMFQLITDILAFLKKKNLAEMQIEAAVNTLEADLAVLDESLVKENAIKNPWGMNEAENLRDNYIRKLHNGLVFFSENYPDNKKTEAANKLLEIVTKYGGAQTIATMPMEQESATLTNLLQEIETEEMTKNVKTLHFEDLVSELKNNNNAFIAIKQERDSGNAIAIAGKTKLARTQVEASFRKLCELINAHITIGGEEKYTDTVETISHLIKLSTDSAEKSRRSKSKKKTETETETETETVS